MCNAVFSFSFVNYITLVCIIHTHLRSINAVVSSFSSSTFTSGKHFEILHARKAFWTLISSLLLTNTHSASSVSRRHHIQMTGDRQSQSHSKASSGCVAYSKRPKTLLKLKSKIVYARIREFSSHVKLVQSADLSLRIYRILWCGVRLRDERPLNARLNLSGSIYRYVA